MHPHACFPRRAAAALFVTASLILWQAPRLSAQANTVDPIFGGTSLDLYEHVQHVAVQTDGKVLVEGGRISPARLATDGTLDTTFQPAFPAGFSKGSTVALQADGRLVIIGSSTQTDGSVRTCLARLTTTGALDASFAPTFNGTLSAGVVQTDGKIVVGGLFTQVNGVTRNHLARLNTDGSLDTTFDAGINYVPPGTPDPLTGLSGESSVSTVVLQPDGALVITGGFTKIRGVSRAGFARIKTDGTLDSGYSPSVFGSVYCMAVQADNKLLLGGPFTAVNGTSRPRLARLNADGSLDTSFAPSVDDYVELVYPAANNTILIGGNFSTVNGVAHSHLARLTSTGSLDSSFTLTADDRVRSAATGPDGKIAVGGYFSTIGGASRNSLALIDTNGQVDANFLPDLASGANSIVWSVAAQTNGMMLFSGDFTQFNGAAHSHIARTKADGSIDTSFTASLDQRAQAIVLSSDGFGKILLGGVFTTVNGTARSSVARLNADGTLDNTFSVSVANNNPVYALATQITGNILLGGAFYTVNGVSCPGITRVKSTGALDATFRVNPSGAPFGLPIVYAIASQIDEKILVGSNFTKFDGVTHNHLVRLNLDGSVDNSFYVDLDDVVRAIAVQPDGKILVGGNFVTVNGVTRGHLVRLNSDGNPDTTFNPSVLPTAYQGTSAYVNSIVVQSNGKIMVSALIYDSNNVASSNVFHLLADGTADPFFNGNRGTDGAVYGLARLPDDRVLMGGDFTTFNNNLRNHVAVMKADATPAFFAGANTVGSGFYYLKFPNGNPFGYYNVVNYPVMYHVDLGFEYFFDAQDGYGGTYLYDYASNTFWYTSPTFPFPYLYDFSLQAFLYYYPDPNNAGHYNTNGVRYFYNFSTGRIISK